jgi:hypothetical protein|tara:strand:- start:210 stop:617 length:408 start_codon:yes stop_codon:yes gene_type:complete
MNKQELKKVLKPLIKECVKEVMFEQGVLSGLISEVVQGLNVASPSLVKTTPPAGPLQSPRINEDRQKVLDAIGKGAYGGVDLFEGTTPITGGGETGPSSAGGTTKGPMADIDPHDPGVDIGGIMRLAGGPWKQLG